jgi:hypothetical protein
MKNSNRYLRKKHLKKFEKFHNLYNFSFLSEMKIKFYAYMSRKKVNIPVNIRGFRILNEFRWLSAQS